MENISYIGLSQQLALQQQMEITANNIANIDTPGYKEQKTLFVDYLSRPKQGEKIAQVLNYGTYRNLAPGSFSQTHNPLDVAIEGDGYLVVDTPEGKRYTRDGGMSLNVNRELVNKSGYRILSEGGAGITIPPEATHVTISPNGEVSTQIGVIGRIKVVDFDRPQKLVREGENLLNAGMQPEVPPERMRLIQGSLEQSNVNAVLEMNRMIEILRMFQATQRMLQTDHDRIRNTIQKLTRV